jgi:hypothetical protein
VDRVTEADAIEVIGDDVEEGGRKPLEGRLWSLRRTFSARQHDRSHPAH